jgi:hypothetical protein
MAGVKKMKARGGGKGEWKGEKSLERWGMERWIASLLRVPGRGALTGKGRQQASHDLDHKKENNRSYLRHGSMNKREDEKNAGL